MIPKLEEVKYLHEPVTPGEMTLLESLDQWLDDTYEVFFQPRVNGNHMDVVVLREGSGALIIEVKDWHLESYEITDGRWSVNTQRGPGPLAEDPVEQVTRYREALYRLYLNGFAETLLSNKNMYAMIGRCVFFYNASTQEYINFGLAAYYANIPDVAIEYLTVAIKKRPPHRCRHGKSTTS